MASLSTEIRWLWHQLLNIFTASGNGRGKRKKNFGQEAFEKWRSERPQILREALKEAYRIANKYCSLKTHKYYSSDQPESIITEMLPQTHGYVPNIAVILKVHPDDFAEICQAEGFESIEMLANKLELLFQPEQKRLFYINHNGLRIITDASLDCNDFFKRIVWNSIKIMFEEFNNQRLKADDFKQALVERGMIFTDPVYNANIIAIILIDQQTINIPLNITIFAVQTAKAD